MISSDLGHGISISKVKPLLSNDKLCFQGCKLVGAGFQVTPGLAAEWISRSPQAELILRDYWAGRDVTQSHTPRFVIDFFGIEEAEAASRFPELYQHVLLHVRPEREKCKRDAHRIVWWQFGEKRPGMRSSLEGLSRYIVTSEVAKHRTFVFLDWPKSLIDGSVIAISSDDAYMLGVLSSSTHQIWSARLGGRMGVGNDLRYNNSLTFWPFPFPTLEEGDLKQRIRDLGERLDAHRKRQLEQHPGLTMTGMYNVLEKLRSEEPLNAKEKTIHDQGLVTLLQQLHDELDAAVLEAYGWSDLLSSPDFSVSASQPFSISEAELLTRLVALNHERAAEEKRGLIRWLRPDYQNPTAVQAVQTTLTETETATAASSHSKSNIQNPTLPSWPDRLPDQVNIIRHLLTQTPTATSEELSQHFGRKTQKRTDQIQAILETLKALGQI
jgi:hypothetical protein